MEQQAEHKIDPSQGHYEILAETGFLGLVGMSPVATPPPAPENKDPI